MEQSLSLSHLTTVEEIPSKPTSISMEKKQQYSTSVKDMDTTVFESKEDAIAAMHTAANGEVTKRKREQAEETTTSSTSLKRANAMTDEEMERLMNEDAPEPQDTAEAVEKEIRSVSKWENELRKTLYRMGVQIKEKGKIDKESGLTYLIDYHNFVLTLDYDTALLKSERANWKRKEKKMIKNIQDSIESFEY
jgi:tellurite resistance protein